MKFDKRKLGYLESILPKQDDVETNILIREEAEFLARNLVSLREDDPRFSAPPKHLDDDHIVSHLHKLDKQSFDNSKRIELLQKDTRESKELIKRIENLLTNNNNNSLNNITNNPETEEDDFDQQNLFEYYNKGEDFVENIDALPIEEKENQAVENGNKELDNSQFVNFKNELQDIFGSFENHMQTMIYNLGDVVSKINDKTNLAISNTNKDVSAEIKTEDLVKEIVKQPVDDDIEKFTDVGTDQPFIFVDETLDVSKEKSELMQSFEKILNLRLEDANSKIASLTDEIEFTKESFNNFINEYQVNLDVVIAQQKDLHSSLNTNNLAFANEFSTSKESIAKIKSEIENISAAWIESNKLLTKLESLIYEISNARFGYDEDLNALIDEIKNQTIDNKNSLLKLNNEIETVKDKVQILSDKQDDLYLETNESKENIKNLQKQVKLMDDSNFERFLKIEDKLNDHSKKLDSLDVRVKDISNIETFLDNVLSSKLFQKSLESKITNMICENNNYLGDEFKFRIDHIANKVNLDLSEFKQDQRNLNNLIQSIENKVYDISSQVSLMDKKYDIRDQLEVIDNKYSSLFGTEIEKIKNSISNLTNHIDNFKLSDHEISNLVNESSQLSKIIKDKIYIILDEKVNQIAKDVETISKNIEKNVIDASSRVVLDGIKSEIESNISKIKNEALSNVYAELTKRDKTIDLHGQEIVRNYETMMKCNSLLEELEFLVVKQSEDLDGLKMDKDHSFDALLEKINSQKETLNRLNDFVETGFVSFDFYNKNESMKKLLGVWKDDLTSNMIQLVKTLVEDEIKKKATLSYVQKQEVPTSSAGDDFFTNRVKDILNRLDSECLKSTFKEKMVNLNVKINDLKEENPNVKDDDFNWFYEKEYNEFVSSKRKEN